jgi:hypothetical protein
MRLKPAASSYHTRYGAIGAPRRVDAGVYNAFVANMLADDG